MPVPLANGEASDASAPHPAPQHLHTQQHMQSQGAECRLLPPPPQEQMQQQLQMQALQQQMMLQQTEPVTIAVPTEVFRVLARDQGSQIASIELMSNAKIQYARWKQMPESTDTWLAIYGEPENVSNARTMLLQVVEFIQRRLRSGDLSTHSMGGAVGVVGSAQFGGSS